MRIASIKIRNILGIDTLDINPKTMTTARGKNGQGKTSLIEAIKAAFGGGKDATLLRKGEKEGEIVIVLDDGTKFTRKVTNEGDKGVTIRDGATGPVKATATYTDAILDGLATNPIAFLTAKEKDQAAMMLEAIPMTVTHEQLEAAAHMKIAVKREGHAMEVIAETREQLFKERTDLNRDIKNRKETIKSLKEALPDESDLIDWSPEIQRLEEEKEALTEAKHETELRISNTLTEQNRVSEQGYNGRIADAAAKRDAAIKAANLAYDEVKMALDTRKSERIQSAQLLADTERKDAAAHFEPELQRIAGELATAKGKNEAFIKSKGAQEHIVKAEAELKEADHFASMRTVAMEGLDKLMMKLTENLPIEGLQVLGGAISVDGVPFSRLNTAARVKIAVKIAAFRTKAKGLNIICADGMEVLDSEGMQALEEELASYGLQAFVTRVTDEPFTVATV